MSLLIVCDMSYVICKSSKFIKQLNLKSAMNIYDIFEEENIENSVLSIKRSEKIFTQSALFFYSPVVPVFWGRMTLLVTGRVSGGSQLVKGRGE